MPPSTSLPNGEHRTHLRRDAFVPVVVGKGDHQAPLKNLSNGGALRTTFADPARADAGCRSATPPATALQVTHNPGVCNQAVGDPRSIGTRAAFQPSAPTTD